MVQGENHLEWPILGKLPGFYGCLLLDPWISISYHLRAIVLMCLFLEKRPSFGITGTVNCLLASDHANGVAS